MNSIQEKSEKLSTSQEYSLPNNLSDYESLSELDARNYLITEPACMALNCGEIRALIDMNSKNDNQKLLKDCFEKLAKLPLTKWLSLVEKCKKNFTS